MHHFVSLPPSRLQHVTELLLYDNMLDTIPPSLFEMGSLEMLNLDRNHLMELPSTVCGIVMDYSSCTVIRRVGEYEL